MPVPRVSVVIDTFNHERFIEQAILSVLDQDFSASETEIIVVDDGSTDRTPEIVRKFGPRLRLLSKANGGQASAFNAAIPETHGEVVAFLDGDDWWARTKLSLILDAFAKNGDVAAVGHGYYEVHDDAPPTEMFVPQTTCRLDLLSPDAARVASIGRTLLGTSRLAVRRRVLERVGAIPAKLVFCADTPLLTLSMALGGAIVLEQPLCYYRLHSGSLFAHVAGDTAKLRRRSDMLAFLLDYLPKRLAELGVHEETISALFEADHIELARLQFEFGETSRWKCFQLEMRDSRTSYRNAGLGYLLFKSVAASMALILPPSKFYSAREWYGRKNLKRFRTWFTDAGHTVSPDLFQRRPIVRND